MGERAAMWLPDNISKEVMEAGAAAAAAAAAA